MPTRPLVRRIPPALQPRYQEVVDRMVGQLLRLLWEQERVGNGRYRCAAR